VTTKFVKRGLDFTIALAALTVLAPLLLLIAAVVWMADFRSPVFAGPRMARGGGEFRMLKFRTMYVDAWKSGVNSTAAGDRRITPVGEFLRRFKLDELPQLINVLAGDMSLVGPRPQVRADAEMYTKAERRLLDARPGITDLASIVFADEAEILKGSRDPDLEYNRVIRPWKNRLGLLYVENRSLGLDLRILAWTALSIFDRRRALDRVGEELRRLGADELTCRMAARREPLIAHPPPGADRIVESYPAKAVTA
jgi:lipopolysaccharide/colanic/teichoic acid biosynthesis glycosyltransferase